MNRRKEKRGKCARRTQSKYTAQEEAEDKQHGGDCELAGLSDRGDEGRAGCPDLVQ
jgi:hypothetical protein